jgi:outer membrane receptor protein involved in Fe transport
VRLTIGGRVDKFGNLADPVFSPRIAAIVKVAPQHTVRASFNRAFRSPSVINNYLNTQIVALTDLSPLGIAQPFPLVVNAVGSKLPINGTAQPELTEESLTAYEVAYTASIARTTATAAFYVNDLDDNINFVQLPNNLDPYTAQNPPPGWPLPPGVLTLLAARGIFLPRTAFTYLNLGPVREKGLELSLDQRFARGVSAFVNYSWQAKPTVLDSATPFPVEELALPPTNRCGAVRRQGVLERRPVEPVPRLQRRLHDGQRQLRREVDGRPRDDDGQGDEPAEPGDPAARIRRYPEALDRRRGADRILTSHACSGRPASAGP